MKTKSECKDFTKRRLLNSLKGQALLCKSQNDMMATPEEKLMEMEVIGEFVKYIENYEINKHKIEEYEFWQKHMEDDGR